jgi:hypothetical protein
MKFVLYYSNNKSKNKSKNKSNSKSNNIIVVDEIDVIDELYNNLAMLVTIDQLKNTKNDKLIQEIIKTTDSVNISTDSVNISTDSVNISTDSVDVSTDSVDYADVYIDKFVLDQKIKLSKLSYKIPLFDYSTKNIYLVSADDIYIKVTMFNYRFPDNRIIELLLNTIKELESIKLPNTEWVDKYLKKINKNINFLSNFDLDILKETFTDVFLNTNPTSRELTSCIKPSYLPYQDYQSPYYTKSELVSMALNLNLPIVSDTKIKPWSYSDSDLKKICKSLSEYEINTQMLIYNQLYILYNNAKSYVQYYSLFGSHYFNNYLRNTNSVTDTELDTHINNFLKIIEKTPAFDSDYEVYRFIESDDYLSGLKIGDIFDERSFISTTRNPFYSMKDNVFGFIILKIKLKKGIPGVALLMESYSNYPHEQEVLLPPSKLKLVSINNDFKYYHWNKLAEKKIIKKYVFDYVETISYNIRNYTSTYTKFDGFILEIDFFKQSYGTNPSESMYNFFNSLTKINLRRFFYSTIGQTKYKFSAYFLTQNKVYSKFFFLQKSETDNKFLGDEFYLCIQNPSNGEIELIIEIRNVISVNYYHRFSGLSNKIPENDLLHWLSGLAKSLNINTIIIHGNYSSYAHIVENILTKSNLNQDTLLTDFKTIQNIDNPDANILNLYTADINTYCIDLIEYIFENKKRFGTKPYINRKVPLHLIDKLDNFKFETLYKSYGKTEHIYDDLYRTFIKLNNVELSTLEFYKIVHNLYPYMIPNLNNLIILSLPRSSILPWHFYYVFKPFEYLFEKGLIPFIPATDLDKIDQMVKNLADEVKFIHENKFRQI